MTSEQVIRFGHLRQNIDAGQALTIDESKEYSALLLKVQSDLPHQPTDIMNDDIAKVNFQQFTSDMLKFFEKFLIENGPAIIQGLLKK